MAGKSASIMVKLLGDDSQLKRTLGSTETGLQKLSTKFTSAGKSMMKAGGLMTAGITLPMVAALKVGMDNAVFSEKANTQLQAALKSTSAEAWISKEAMDERALAQQHMLGIDDDVIKSNQAVLLTFTNIKNEMGEGNDIFYQASDAALNLSVALGTDLQSATTMVGKALNDPVQGINAMTRAGIQFTESQKDTIKTMVEAGDTMGAQKIILGELETQFGGSAAAAADTFAGRMAILKERFGDIFQQLAESLMPTLESLGGILANLAEKWENLGEGGQKVVGIMLLVVAAFGPILTIAGTVMRLVGTFSTLIGKLRTVTTTATGTTTQLTRLGTAAKVAGGFLAAFALIEIAGMLNDATKDALGLEIGLNDLASSKSPQQVAESIKEIAGSTEGWAQHANDYIKTMGGMIEEQVLFIGPAKDVRIELDNVGATLEAIKNQQPEMLGEAIRQFEESKQGAGLLNTEMSNLDGVLDDYRRWNESAQAAAEGAADGTEEFTGNLIDGGVAAEDLTDQVKTLTEQLQEMAGGARNADGAQRDLLSASQSLTEAFGTNGDTLDIMTEAGRDNMDALENQIDASFDLAEAQMEVDSSGQSSRNTLEAQANTLRDLRDRGIIPTDEEYNRLLTSYGLTPSDINTKIDADTRKAQEKAFYLHLQLNALPGVSEPAKAEIKAAIASGDYGRAEALLNHLQRERQAVVRAQVVFPTGSIFGNLPGAENLGRIGGRAKGGPIRKGHPYIVGEEGPELVMPDHNGNVIAASKTAAMMGRSSNRAVGSASGEIHVHFHGPVAKDAERWIVDTVESAAAKGYQLPKLKKAVNV